MQIVYKKIADLKRYEKNNKKHPEKQLIKIVASIKEYGFKNPVLIDKNNVIIAGHGRTLAAERMGMEEVPCIDCSDLNSKQVKALRLMDNKSAELAEWDFDNIKAELEELKLEEFDIDLTGFDMSDLQEKDFDNIENSSALDNTLYTKKIDAPIYEMTGEKPEIKELFNFEKTEKLIERINLTKIKEEEKLFLIEAAKRHTVFNYGKIAEYYAHAEKDVQELMEESALVIIDFDRAMRNGFIKLTKEMGEIYSNDLQEFDDD